MSFSDKYPSYDVEKLDFFLKDLYDGEGEIPKECISKKFGFYENEASFLIKKYPPDIYNEKKKLLFTLASCDEIEFKGKVKFSRFEEMNIPRYFPTERKVKYDCQNNVYVYDRLAGYDDSKQRDWHVNFADECLFGYYGGGLFAQEEMLSSEMPIVTSLVRYLGEIASETNENLSPWTRRDKYATPCLIRNAQRRIRVSTDRNEEEGRPNGLYGNRFNRGSEEVIKKATHVFPNPQLENIISMEAPSYGSGNYDLQTVLFILKTAFTGFMAAKIETIDELGREDSIVCVHTGNWGTGAYGGNKDIMSLIQIAAAELAGIDIYVFHSSRNIRPFLDSKKRFLEYVKGEKKVDVMDFARWVVSLNFEWGMSDGN